MSYKLFDQGLSSDEINKMKKAHGAEDHVMEQLRKWRESEHVLNILRTIKASEGILDKMEMETWKKAISGRI
jgi:hypothetical protein